MVNTKYLRYLVIIPCVIALFLILTASSKAETETDYEFAAIQQSSADESFYAANDNSNPDQDTITTENVNERLAYRTFIEGLTTSDWDMALDSVDLFSYANVNDITVKPKNTITFEMIQFENGTQNTNISHQDEDITESRVPLYNYNSDANLWLLWDKALVSPHTILPAIDGDAVANVQSSYTRFQPFDKNAIRPALKKPPPQDSLNTGKSKEEISRFSREIVTIHVDPLPELGLVMFSRIVNPIASSNIRGEIVEYVRANPGEHMSKIKRKLKISTSSAVHHLRILEKTGIILAHKDGKYMRYFVNENGYRSSINGEYKSIFSVLKNKNSRVIASFLISKPHSTLSEVSKMINLNPSSVHWHVERLEEANIISKVKDGKFVRYYIEDTEIVEKALACLSA